MEMAVLEPQESKKIGSYMDEEEINRIESHMEGAVIVAERKGIWHHNVVFACIIATSMAKLATYKCSLARRQEHTDSKEETRKTSRQQEYYKYTTTPERRDIS